MFYIVLIAVGLHYIVDTALLNTYNQRAANNHLTNYAKVTQFLISQRKYKFFLPFKQDEKNKMPALAIAYDK